MIDFFRRWGLLMVGTLSLIPAVWAAVSEIVKEGGLTRLSFWLFAYLCLIVNWWLERQKSREAEKRLGSFDLTEARRGERGAQLARLEPHEREAVRLTLTSEGLTAVQAAAWVSGAPHMWTISQKTTFLQIDTVTEVYRVREEWRALLSEFFYPPAPQPIPLWKKISNRMAIWFGTCQASRLGIACNAFLAALRAPTTTSQTTPET
jgi:hypothetical protein